MVPDSGDAAPAARSPGRLRTGRDRALRFPSSGWIFVVSLTALPTQWDRVPIRPASKRSRRGPGCHQPAKHLGRRPHSHHRLRTRPARNPGRHHKHGIRGGMQYCGRLPENPTGVLHAHHDCGDYHHANFPDGVAAPAHGGWRSARRSRQSAARRSLCRNAPPVEGMPGQEIPYGVRVTLGA